jgi:hypothetical protein
MISSALHSLSRNLGEESIIEHRFTHSLPPCCLAEPEKTHFTSERAEIMKTKASNLHRRAARITVGVILTLP